MVHIAGTAAGFQLRTLVWIDRTGREETIAAPPRAYAQPRISPDGTQVALGVRDQEDDIWIWSVMRQTLTRLTFDPGIDRFPVWTPDGRRIVFTSQRAGSQSNLFWQAADGTGMAERLTESSSIQYASSISADGTMVVLEQLANTADVVMVALTGGALRPFDRSALQQPQGRPDLDRGATGSGRGEAVEPRRMTSLVATMFAERNADLLADGRWIAYQSNESGRYEVYVRPFPGVDGGRWQVSSGGGEQPVWSSNSRELFYVDPEGRIVAVPVQPGPGFVAGNPRVVVDGSYAPIIPGFTGRLYDVSRDGQRFLLMKPVEGAQQQAPSPQIIVIQDWFEELKRLAPR